MTNKPTKSKHRENSNTFHIEINDRGALYHQAVSSSTRVPTTSSDMLRQINSQLHRQYYSTGIGFGVLVGITGIVLLNFLESNRLDLVALSIAWIAGLSLIWFFHRLEEAHRVICLHYMVDEPYKQRFSALHKSILTLTQAKIIWNVTSRTPNYDWKRHAGATQTVTRKRVIVDYLPCPYIKTNVKTLGIRSDSFQLFFLPDYVWVFQNREYQTISYNAINIHSEIVTFIEYENVPKDADVTGYTWRYVRKDGGPDLRFSNNRQIPKVRYGCINLHMNNLTLQLYVSNMSYVQALDRVVDYYSLVHHQKKTSSNASYNATSNHQAKSNQNQQTHSQKSLDDPYVILGVSHVASKEEITAAYRKMAQLYHPDKVANLAPEFKDLAEKRMKAINTAYDELKRKF